MKKVLILVVAVALMGGLWSEVMQPQARLAASGGSTSRPLLDPSRQRLADRKRSGTAAIRFTCRGCDLSQLRLRQADLENAILDQAWFGAGTDLRGARLAGASLESADLSGALLEEVDLSGARLVRTNLAGANLRGAKFSGAVMRFTDFSGADLSGADFSGTYIDAGSRFEGAICPDGRRARNDHCYGRGIPWPADSKASE
jgi:uncharacterized protein YjbI with pentapeptide repeats